MSAISTADKKFQRELNSGATSLVLLSILARAQEPLYGYQIAKQLDAGSEGPAAKVGALYPVLRSLERSGLLASRVEPSVSGPPRRYYRITRAGRGALERWLAIWERNRRFVDAVIGGDYHV
ncbi:MAG: helix-turn-helix transcriptional regulator [Candidatus Krumholzibacteriota bacterium]|nr:helix-turn-helix transcriptional regulator [Candidatus Krumholzibacteriota bacterium]